MRCFVAIELPESIRRGLAALRARLAALDRLVRWSPPEQVHLTLQFLGAARDDKVAALCAAVTQAVAGRRRFELEVQGAGCFPQHGSPRVIWAGVAGPPPELIAVHAALGDALAGLGYPAEPRAYRPHLTLARTRERSPGALIRSALHELSGFAAGRFEVAELVLFESVLGKHGATHIPLVRAPLLRCEM